MRLHYLRGDRAAAIAVFERFEQRLKDEQGTPPSAETIELLATIERGGTALPARRAVVPASLIRPPRLVGRERELVALDHAWSARRTFLLVGEAGIGKSRLLQEFCAGRDGIVALRARPGDAGIAYAVLARLLRALLAEHGVAAQRGAPAGARPGAARAGRAGRARGRSAAAAAAPRRRRHAGRRRRRRPAGGGRRRPPLRRRRQHRVRCRRWSQSDTLAALHWGFAQRPAEADAPLARMRAALEEAGRIETVALQPLDLAQLAQLIESLGLPELDVERLAPALLKHTGGNSMFALETLKDLVLSGQAATLAAGARLPQPVSVGALVERRLAQLSSEALRLARVAALAGPDFSAELAATVLEAHPLDIAEPWRELETAQVLRDGAFAHDLIFEATRKSVPEPIARLLHRRIAAAPGGRASAARQRRAALGRRGRVAPRRRGLRGRGAARPRGVAAHATRSSAGAAPPRPSTGRRGRAPRSMRAARASTR